MDADDPAMRVITEPGIYPGLPADVYHSDPWRPGGSLSSSGARRLLKCPAAYRYGPGRTSRRLDYGTAAHTQVLGTGAAVVEVAGSEKNGAWSTAEAKTAVAAARAAGQVPVKPEEYRRIKAMAARLAEHRTAAALFAPGSGQAEASLFWVDAEFGVPCRARLDFLPWGGSGQVIVPDYKTAESAAPAAVAKAMVNYGYHVQGAFYAAGVEYFRPGAEVVFALVVQEIAPPYLVEAYYLDADAMAEGARRCAVALEKYRDCRACGVWPGYDPGESLKPLGLPRWGYVHEDDDW